MGFSVYSIFVFFFNYFREVLTVIMSKWQMSIDKFMLFFRPLPLSTLPCSAWWSISWSWSWLRQLPWWRQWYDDNLMMMATIGSTCMMAVRKHWGLKKPGSHTEIGRLKSAVHPSSWPWSLWGLFWIWLWWHFITWFCFPALLLVLIMVAFKLG